MAEKRVKEESKGEESKGEARVFEDLNEIFEHNTKESLWLLIN